MPVGTFSRVGLAALAPPFALGIALPCLSFPCSILGAVLNPGLVDVYVVERVAADADRAVQPAIAAADIFAPLPCVVRPPDRSRTDPHGRGRLVAVIGPLEDPTIGAGGKRARQGHRDEERGEEAASHGEASQRGARSGDACG